MENYFLFRYLCQGNADLLNKISGKINIDRWDQIRGLFLIESEDNFFEESEEVFIQKLTEYSKQKLSFLNLAQNQELQLKNDNLGVQVQVLQSERSAQMFLYGAATLAVGVLLGFFATLDHDDGYDHERESQQKPRRQADLDDKLWDEIQRHINAGHLVLCMGAGSIDGWVRQQLVSN